MKNLHTTTDWKTIPASVVNRLNFCYLGGTFGNTYELPDYAKYWNLSFKFWVTNKLYRIEHDVERVLSKNVPDTVRLLIENGNNYIVFTPTTTSKEKDSRQFFLPLYQIWGKKFYFVLTNMALKTRSADDYATYATNTVHMSNTKIYRSPYIYYDESKYTLNQIGTMPTILTVAIDEKISYAEEVVGEFIHNLRDKYTFKADPKYCYNYMTVLVKTLKNVEIDPDDGGDDQIPEDEGESDLLYYTYDIYENYKYLTNITGIKPADLNYIVGTLDEDDSQPNYNISGLNGIIAVAGVIQKNPSENVESLSNIVSAPQMSKFIPTTNNETLKYLNLNINNNNNFSDAFKLYPDNDINNATLILSGGDFGENGIAFLPPKHKVSGIIIDQLIDLFRSNFINYYNRIILVWI